MNRGMMGGLAVVAGLVAGTARAHVPEGMERSELDESALEPQLTSVERDVDGRLSIGATAPLLQHARPSFEGFVKPALGASVLLHDGDALSFGFASAVEQADGLELVLPLFAETSLGPLAMSVEAAYHVIRDGDEVSVDVGFELPLWRELAMIAVLEGAATPALEEPELRGAAGFSWKPREHVSLMALAGDAVRDVPFELREQLFMLATRADW